MSDPHKKSGSLLKPSWTMGVVVTLVLLVFCFAVPKIGEWTARNEGTDAGTQNAASQPASPVRDQLRASSSAPSAPFERKPVTANAHSGSWTWFDVPSGYHPMICEADESLTCTSTETDISAVNFELQCKDLRGNLLDWRAPADLIGCQVRAKGDTPLNLAVWIEPL